LHQVFNQFVIRLPVTNQGWLVGHSEQTHLPKLQNADDE